MDSEYCTYHDCYKLSTGTLCWHTGEFYGYCDEHGPRMAETVNKVFFPYANKEVDNVVVTGRLIDKLTSEERKTYPVALGVLDYFPDAIAYIAHVSYVGNDQHNPGTPTHWDRSKSGDESDALMRHFLSRGTVDSDGLLHSGKLAWRALALLQKELEDASTRD